MSQLWVTVEGHRLTIAQVLAIREVGAILGEYEWHMNECQCCVCVHPKGEHHRGYIVDQSGEYDWVDLTPGMN